MLKLRTDIIYVKEDGKLTQAGVEAIQGQLDGQATSSSAEVAALTATVTALDGRVVLLETGARVRLATKTASASANLSFTEFNNTLYRRYEFELDSVLPATDNTTLWLRTSTNAGSSYDAGAADYSYSNTEKGSGAEVDSVDSLGAAQIILCTSVGNAAGEQGVSGTVAVWGAGVAARTTVRTFIHSFDAADSSPFIVQGAGARLANQDTDAVRFLFSSGNITSGTIRMYGIV